MTSKTNSTTSSAMTRSPRSAIPGVSAVLGILFQPPARITPGSVDDPSEEETTVVGLPVNPITLNFHSPELEAEYRTTITRRYAPYIRIALFLSVTLIFWFALFDWYYMDRAPNAYKLSLLFRATVMVPGAIIFFIFTFSSKYATYGSPVASLIMFCIYSCWGPLILVGGVESAEYFSAAMIHTLLFGSLLLNIRFSHVFVHTWLALAGYFAFIWVSDLPTALKLFLTAEIAVINQMLNLALYIIERLLRQSYYQQSVIASINAERVSWLETMTGFLRHELKNKMVGIRTSLELIQRRHNDDSTQAYIKRGLTNIDTMSTVLSHTSDATSIEASLYTESREYFSLGELIHEQLDALRDVQGTRNVSVERFDRSIVVYGIQHRIAQLFENLLFNALDHANGDRVEITLAKEGTMAKLSVMNEGKLLPKDASKIFDLFMSERDLEKTETTNMGLGLYLVKLISTTHGGSVIAENLTDRTGVIFTVRFPIASNRGFEQLQNPRLGNTSQVSDTENSRISTPEASKESFG